MPQVAFVDEELSKELEKIKTNGNEKEIFPEHEFVASCLRIGLSISDLKQMTYVDAMKILLAYIGYANIDNKRTATQKDIDKLLGQERATSLILMEGEKMAGSIKGIIVEIGGDTSGLQKALSKVNSATASLSKELRRN